MGGKGKEPELDAAPILKVEIASGSVDVYVCSGIHTGETRFLRDLVAHLGSKLQAMAERGGGCGGIH